MLKALTIAFALCMLSSCTNDKEALSTLENSGFSNVQLVGHQFFRCGKDDTSATGFVADNPKGKRVMGTVCCGTFKGCTIRF